MTLDLEPDYGNMKKESFDILDQHEKIKKIMDWLKINKIPLNIFVTGKVIEKKPEVIDIFRKYNCEFFSHGYKHDLKNPVNHNDIELGTKIFYNHFGYRPIGYRAPQGKITKAGLKKLIELNYTFDSSIFPTFWPNLAKYIFSKKMPHYLINSKILEFPFATLKPVNVTFSLSYQKLFGFNFYKYFIENYTQTNIIIYDSHLHDLITGKLIKELNLFWKFVYNRNRDKGFNILINTIPLIRDKGYKFVLFSDILKIISKSLK